MLRSQRDEGVTKAWPTRGKGESARLFAFTVVHKGVRRVIGDMIWLLHGKKVDKRFDIGKMMGILGACALQRGVPDAT